MIDIKISSNEITVLIHEAVHAVDEMFDIGLKRRTSGATRYRTVQPDPGQPGDVPSSKGGQMNNRTLSYMALVFAATALIVNVLRALA